MLLEEPPADEQQLLERAKSERPDHRPERDKDETRETKTKE